MDSFYQIVPGTQVLHSITDVYELTDEQEGSTFTVKLQADNAGVYIESSEKSIDSGPQRVTECMSIGSKELAIVVAKRILELYGHE